MANDNTFDLPVDDTDEAAVATETPKEPKPKKPKTPKPVASDATPKEPKPKAKADGGEEDAGLKLLSLKGKGGKIEELKISQIVRHKDAQSRAGLGESAVNEERVDTYAEAMREQKKEFGEIKFPPVSVMLVEDGIGEYRGIPTYFLFDGFHTTEAADKAGLKTIKAKVYKGTRADLAAAAASANIQHDTAGQRRSNADKVRAVQMAGKAYALSEMPKDEWPSNRALAKQLGVGHNLVNELDPFGRSASGPKNELKKAKKRKPTVATPDHADANKFDWGVYESSIGYLVRGLDSMGDLYGFKKTPEFTAAERVLTEFTAFFAGVKKKFGSKKK